MAATIIDRVSFLECAVASRAFGNAAASGDAHVLYPNKNGAVLAVVDGLGHGAEAESAARQAIAAISAYADDSVIGLVRRCHQGLVGTRGVAMSLVQLNRQDETMTWLAVGNVESVLLRRDPAAVPPKEHIVMRGGVVGSRLPMLQATVTTLSDDDVLICATDGIRRGFSERLDITVPPQRLADQILASHGKADDDALVLVARYLGRRYATA